MAEEAENTALPPITAFGRVLIASIQELTEKQETVQISDLAAATGKNAYMIKKAVEKLVRDGYVTATEDEDIGKITVEINDVQVPLTEEDIAVAKKERSPRSIETVRAYQWIKTPEAGPPQMKAILEKLAELGGEDNNPVVGSELFAALEGVLATRQPVVRVFKFYQKRMLIEGLLREVMPSGETLDTTEEAA